MALLDIIKGILAPATQIIDELNTSDEEKLEAKRRLLEVENQITSKLIDYEDQLAQARRDVILAETKSQSRLARNWRPLLMLVFTYIIFYNYALAPVLSIPTVEIPDNMWELLKIGIGGYIIGRSTEKGIKLWKQK